jgi:hypothetical protein
LTEAGISFAMPAQPVAVQAAVPVPAKASDEG